MALIDEVVLRPRNLDFDEPDDPAAGWDAFGSPENLAAVHTNVWRRFLGICDRRGIGGDEVPLPVWVERGVWADVKAETDRLRARVEAAGRFDPDGLARPGVPVRVVPGDVAMIRWANTGGVLQQCSLALEQWGRQRPSDRDPDLPRRAASDVGGAAWLLDGEAFFLPSGWAQSLLASDPPDEETLSRVRLPFPTCVCFFDEVPITDLLPVETDGRLPSITVLGHQSMDLDRVGVVSVALFAGADGVGIEPWFHLGLMVESPDGEGDASKGWVGSWGLMSESVVGHLGENLAGLLTWGSWADPVDVPGRLEGLEPGSREWRRTLRAGAVRRAEPHGALDRTRVIDLRRILGSRPRGEGTDRTVAAHMRRGHWRRVRVAVREGGETVGPTTGPESVEGVTFRYEGRWIPPTMVNPDGDVAEDRVYRLPESG